MIDKWDIFFMEKERMTTVLQDVRKRLADREIELSDKCDTLSEYIMELIEKKICEYELMCIRPLE